MTHPPGLSQWLDRLSTHLPLLSKPQRTTLALYSFAIVLAQSCGITSLSVLLASLLQRPEPNVREQLRDFYRSAQHKSGAKRGHKRRSLDVTSCFAPLLAWVLALLPPDCRQLSLAMDASTLGQRFTILTICVTIRGCAIPVAWRIVEATRPGAWRPHWEQLFELLHGSVPPDWCVTVAADRGLYAHWLFRSIQRVGWHPFLRINRQGQFCAEGESSFGPLSAVVSAVGQRWSGRVRCFKTVQRQLECSLLARWEAGYSEPWLVVTDLAVEECDVAWYGLRAWVECGYKDAKRGGWHWEQTKMSDPERAERLWLAMAVATLLVVGVGCDAEVSLPEVKERKVSEKHIARRTAKGRGKVRSVSCFRRGGLVVVACLILGQGLPEGRLLPEALGNVNRCV